MGVIGRLQETWYRATGKAELAEQLHAERLMVSQVEESMADLANRMYEPGWQQFTAEGDREFARDGLRQISAVCRIMAIKNPLVKRGLSLRQSYIWGQGVQISARDPKVNTVVQDFLDDPGNRRSFTGPTAREELERALGTDGNLFFALFTAPTDGRVQVRTLPWDEISDVITNPDDTSEPWYYQRDWWSEYRDLRSGGIITKRRATLYPALGYRPTSKPAQVRTSSGELAPVLWDAPVVHIKVNGLIGWKFGIGDAYSAIDWAHAYKDFLTDWARLVKSLSRFAWKLTTPGRRQAAARTRLAQNPSRDPLTGDPNHAGATALLTQEMALEAIPKTGATIDSESGRPIAAMAAAALGVPVTMLLGDPGVTGNRATAETLDTPTELMADHRRRVWDEAIKAITTHVIASSVSAPQGALRGTITQTGNRQQLKLRGRAEPTVDIAWPDVDQVSPAVLIDAITKADGTTYLPPLLVVRLLLQALGVNDADEILDQMSGPGGVFLRPDGAGGGAGQAAVDAFRRGEDPAALLRGDPSPPGP